MTRYAARSARIPWAWRKRTTVLGRTPRSVALSTAGGCYRKLCKAVGSGMGGKMNSYGPRDGRGQMEPDCHGDLSYVAVNPGDPAIQRYSSVPGGSLHLHSQHPDAA